MLNFDIMFNTEMNYLDEVISEVQTVLKIDARKVRMNCIQLLATTLMDEQYKMYEAKELVYSGVLAVICLLVQQSKKTKSTKQIVSEVLKEVLDKMNWIESKKYSCLDLVNRSLNHMQQSKVQLIQYN